MICIYCNNEKLYRLKTGQIKCSNCKKKFSLKKIDQKNKIIDCFCRNMTTNETSQVLNLNYKTVANSYTAIRKNIINHLETSHENKEIISYDEYLYLEKSKKSKENIFQSKNFITFCYEEKVYNLLMPNIIRYKSIEVKDFSRFMSFNKISKLKKEQNIIKQFWIFFENNILKYKGIREDNFFYYLKESEFKFNYSLEDQLEILRNL